MIKARLNRNPVSNQLSGKLVLQVAVSRKMVTALLLLSALVCSAAASINCDWRNYHGNGSANGWVRHGASCYRWFEAEDYWHPAEKRCNALHNGHLVSINDDQENLLVGRLTYCSRTWIGRYGIHVDHLANASYYRWTDGTSASANRHNFSRLATPHQPLVTAENLQWFNNLYHARSGFVCEAPSSPSGPDADQTAGCPRNWRRMGDYCYHQPAFKATYIEAGFYCDGRQASLVSLHSERELRLLSLLDLSAASCSLELWVGLVKLNPCRPDFSTGETICYQWADRSGNYTYNGFPAWAVGHPNSDRVTNCVVLKDRNLRSEPCYARQNFVCKKPAEQTTPSPPTAGPTPSTPTPTHLPPGVIKAAYDFRRGTENLVQPGRFRVLDLGGASVNTHGAKINGSRGILLDTESSALTQHLKRNGTWTIFYYVQRAIESDEILVDMSGEKGDPGLSLLEHPDGADLTLYGGTGFFKDNSDEVKGAANRKPWVRGAVVFSSGRATFYRNSVDVSSHSPATSSTPYPANDRYLMLGNAYKSVLTGYHGTIACFGIANTALTKAALEEAFRLYCP